MEQERGLARTVRPHQRHLLAGLHGQLDAAQGFGAVGVGVVEVRDLDAARGRGLIGQGSAHRFAPMTKTAIATSASANQVSERWSGRGSSTDWTVPLKPRASMAA